MIVEQNRVAYEQTIRNLYATLVSFFKKIK